MAGEIEVKVIPNTTALDKELKKPRSFTGLLGFGGGPGTGLDKKDSGKGIEKTNNLLGSILKTTGIIAVISTAFSGLIKLLKPFVELFSAISFLVFFPLWKALKPFLQGASTFAKNLAEEGGGLSGAVRAGATSAEGLFKGDTMAERIAKAFLVAVIAAGAIIIVAILGGIALIPAAIIAGIALIVTLLVLAWDPIKELLGKIAELWGKFIDKMKEVWESVIGFFKRLGESIANFGADLWQFFVDGLSIVKDFGSMVWDIFLDGLSFIRNLGELIWNVIKSSLSNIGGFVGSTVSALNPFDDFLQRPGQAPTAFSPNDTVIGVKDPSKLFGGGGSTINNTFNLSATINNDMDVQVLAERIAQINKDELAMSTGSQRF